MARVLSGMRPTGNLHLGNYFGAIKQFLDLQAAGEECFFFVADIHALTEVTALTEIDRLSVEVAKNYLACGIDDRSTLYRQSDVPEVSEIAVLLGNTVKLGRLHACTTFKDRVRNKGIPEGEVSYGLLGYPVLMASDILCVRANKVPVGQDQVQHVEMTRDFARAFNSTFCSEVFVIPDVNISNPLRVPGIDGAEKMGKSDGNTIALLENLKEAARKVRSIPTQAEAGGEMQAGTRALYTLMELCSSPDVHSAYLRRYHAADGGKFFGEMKKRLAADVVALLTPIQERYAALSDDDVRCSLAQGAARVRPIAAAVLSDMRKAMGLSR
ncbi:MAG TPA: tryptophan--tRNA ligase [Candidatus Kryptobacter bacterium]|nr:tryptophan--tRNA ligase [Candidatus Kryptobacter bacterium]